MIVTGTQRQDEVERLIESKHGRVIFKLADVVAVRQSDGGEISIRLPMLPAVSPRSNHECLAIDLAKIIFEPSREYDRLQLTSAGMDRFFLCKLRNVLAPDILAYLFYIAHDSLIDSRRILEFLGELQGKLYYTLFNPQVEEVLLKQSH